MGSTRRPPQGGFTLIELMIAVAVIGLLASIALGQFRGYTLRAKLSEVILAASHCRNSITEGYLSMTSAPPAGSWGCETSATSQYVSGVQTSSDGAVRLVIANLDPTVNGHHLHLVPAAADGRPMSTERDLSRRVFQWLCGSDVQAVRNALPSSCRTDTTPYASANFQ